MGFGSETVAGGQQRKDELLSQVQPEDLIKFGLIPEFIGRLPVMSALHDLDEDSLVRILSEPKNALVKQFEALFQMDRVKLKLTPEALRAVAKEARKRNTGARGLRAVLEETLLDLMYELPSRNDVRECVITAEVVARKEKPILVLDDQSAKTA